MQVTYLPNALPSHLSPSTSSGGKVSLLLFCSLPALDLLSSLFFLPAFAPLLGPPSLIVDSFRFPALVYLFVSSLEVASDSDSGLCLFPFFRIVSPFVSLVGWIFFVGRRGCFLILFCWLFWR